MVANRQESGISLTRLSSVSTPDSGEPPARLPCPLQNEPAISRAAPALASAAPGARGASRSGGQNCDICVSRILLVPSSFSALPTLRSLAHPPGCHRGEDRETAVRNHNVWIWMVGNRIRQLGKKTYVCACVATALSRPSGSNELVKCSCMYSLKSTPLALRSDS